VPPTSLPLADWAVVGVYFLAVLAVGLMVAPGQKSTRDYFLGGRSVPWWAAALSIIATETSAVTYIGTPAKAFRGDWSFLQMVFGFVAARLFLAYFFVPAFFREEFITVYGLLERRFGRPARVAAAVLFLLGRIVASGVRLYAGCLALEVAAGLSLRDAVLVTAGFGTFYTLAGGIRAVVWTDVLLGITFVVGGLLAAAHLAANVPGGIGGLLADPALAPKLNIFHLAGSPWSADALVTGLIGGFALTLATHGTDQDIAQRILTCRDARGGGSSLIASAFMILPLMALFLAIGTLLFFHYQGRDPGYALPADPNHVFPFYIVRELPLGLRGLVIAGLLAASLSSFSSVLNALASTLVTDFYRPLRERAGRVPSEEHLVRVSRTATLTCGVVLAAVALAFRGSSASVLDVALKALTYFYGALLGVFLLALFSRRGTSASAVAGMAASVPVVLLLQLREWQAQPAAAPEALRRFVTALPEAFRAIPAVPWPWWTVIGAAIAFAVGCAARVSPSPPGAPAGARP
jgi:SSS family transporter